MLGYPRSRPSEIVFLAGIVLVALGIFGSRYFQNPSLKAASQVCGLLGIPFYLVGEIAIKSWSWTGITGNPRYATAFRIFAIILWLALLPLALFWTYLKVHSR
jgi:hypothetical protein